MNPEDVIPLFPKFICMVCLGFMGQRGLKEFYSMPMLNSAGCLPTSLFDGFNIHIYLWSSHLSQCAMLFQLKFSFFINFALMYKSVDVWQTDWFCNIAALKKNSLKEECPPKKIIARKKILWRKNAKKKIIARIRKGKKNNSQWNMCEKK